MKLKKLLAEHDRATHSYALKHNLGDAYLLKHNPIYKKIRIAAIDLKYKFTHKDFYEYEAMPLTQLPIILKHKTIPYFKNVNALREIERARPGHFTRHEIPPLRSNYLLHETAHCVAHSIFLKVGRPTSRNETILRTLIEESFANTVESLFSIYALNDAHNTFLERNTYIYEDVETRVNLILGAKKYGLSFLFYIVFFSFLHANLLRVKVSNADFKKVIDLALQFCPKLRGRISTREIKELRRIFNFGLGLDTEFTESTTAFCLRLMGYNEPLKSLYDFDFLKHFYRGTTESKALVLLCGAIT